MILFDNEHDSEAGSSRLLKPFFCNSAVRDILCFADETTSQASSKGSGDGFEFLRRLLQQNQFVPAGSLVESQHTLMTNLACIIASLQPD